MDKNNTERIQSVLKADYHRVLCQTHSKQLTNHLIWQRPDKPPTPPYSEAQKPFTFISENVTF